MTPLTTNTPFSRAEAFAAIAAMRDGETLTPYQLDRLWLYFAPAIPAKPKTPFQWAGHAIAGLKDKRPSLRYVNVVDGVIYASDGHRLHYAPTTLGDGFYEPKTGTLDTSVDARPPDFQRVIADALQDRRPVEVYETIPAGDTTTTWARFRFIDDKKYALTVDADYLKRAQNGNAGPLYANKTQLSGEGPLGSWVIMHIREPKE